MEFSRSASWIDQVRSVHLDLVVLLRAGGDRHGEGNQYGTQGYGEASAVFHSLGAHVGPVEVFVTPLATRNDNSG
jgi:hypothetical protein